MPPRERAQALSRRHRFTSQGSFGPILRSGRKFRGEHLVVHALPAADGASRIGIALTRRLAPLAVGRNRLKRLVRETFRRHAVMADGIDCIVALRSRLDTAEEPEMSRELAGLLDDLHRSRAQ